MRRNRKLASVLVGLLVFTFVYNEYLIYWQSLLKCEWSRADDVGLVKLMILSDTHLLGSRNGHWFDKLRREWQQYRGFQTARRIFRPDYVVILGDLTDEGKWCSDKEVKRRKSFLFCFFCFVCMNPNLSSTTIIQSVWTLL